MLPEDHDAEPEGLREARRISLTHEPVSPEAFAFTEAVLDMTMPHRDRKRAIGAVTRARMGRELGMILAGLLHADWVAAPRGGGHPMWAKGCLIGWLSFWTHLDALRAAGLTGERPGTHALTLDGGFTGLPTKLRCTQALKAMAQGFGVDGGHAHWRFSVAGLRQIERERPEVSDCIAWRDITGKDMEIPIAYRQAVGPIRARVAALNAHLAAAHVEGCRAPVLVRRFRHGLQLGGRLWAKGSDSITGITRAERQDVRINGEPVAEVDISASHLTIFLALAGAPRPPGDPYAVAGLPRVAVKSWTTASFGSGRAMGRWPDDAPAETAGIKAATVRKAMVDAYPALQDMPAILPRALASSVPKDHLGWALGQFISWHESEAILDALERLQVAGVVALPVHDSLVVPRSAAEVAERALREAYRVRFGVEAQVKVG